MRTYLDPQVPMSAGRRAAQRRHTRALTPRRVRERDCSTQHRFDEKRVQRFQFRPLDMRYAYVETVTPTLEPNRGRCWSPRPRPLSGFLLGRRRAPRALDGAALHFSDCLVDQKVLFTDAYAIPFWLVGQRRRQTASPRVAVRRAEPDAGRRWRPNLSDTALAYLRSLGIDRHADTSQDSATLIWLHALAIGLLAAVRRAERRRRPLRLAAHPAARHRGGAARVGATRGAVARAAQSSTRR